MSSFHEADLDFGVSVERVRRLRPSQLLLVAVHTLASAELSEKARLELCQRRTSVLSLANHDIRRVSLAPSSQPIPAGLELAFYPEHPKARGRALSDVENINRSGGSLINAGWVGQSGLESVEEFRAEAARLRGRRRESIEMPCEGQEDREDRTLSGCEVEGKPTLADCSLVNFEFPRTTPLTSPSTPTDFRTVSTFTLVLPQSQRTSSFPPRSLSLRQWGAVPYLGPMSPYLWSKPPPPPFSTAHQQSILSFLIYCAPLRLWSLLPPDRLDRIEKPHEHSPAIRQVHSSSLDKTTRGPPADYRSKEPRDQKSRQDWVTMSIVIDWIWGGTRKQRWDEARWIMTNTDSHDLVHIMRIYAGQHRFRKMILMAWGDLHLYLSSLKLHELTPHLRRAQQLVAYLGGARNTEGHETKRDFFFSDADDVVRDQPWLKWFDDLEMSSETLKIRLEDWEREEWRLREGKPKRQES